VNVDPAIMPAPEPAGRRLGEYRGVPVHLVAAHDTACAFAASPLGADDSAFVSAGTWVLVGIERALPDTSQAAQAANFSNEIGALGGYRFLKNVPGFWLLEQCAAIWNTSAAELLERAADEPAAPVFDVHDERFLAPERMDDEVRLAADLGPEADEAIVARSIVESIAHAVGRVVDELRQWQPVSRLVVVGGGGASPLVRDRFAAHAGAEVVPGATEATALGNALVQGIALGRFAGLEAARHWSGGVGG
jgi:rhamnulokinase